MIAMSSQRDSQDDREWDYEEVDKSDRGALEKVINETLLGRPDRPVERQQIQALIRVAAKHAEHELNADSILKDLVETVLQYSFQSQKISSTCLSEMSLEIAQALYDAPATKSRLVVFWNQLREAS